MKFTRRNRWLAGLVMVTALLLVAPIQSPQTANALSPSAGLVLWLRSDLGVTTSGDKVVDWADQSGNNNHAFPTTASYQPTFVAGALNGLPVLRFDGGQLLLLSSPVSPQNFTIFIVGKNRQPAETFSIILGPNGSGPNNQLRWENGSELRMVGLGNNLPDSTAAFGDTRTYHALTVRHDHDGGTLAFYRDGGLVMGRTAITTGPWTFAQIGAWYSSYFLVGDIAEILVYSKVLSESERSNVNAYLQLKYGLP